ncbi:MAG: magnesium transporter [Burkholderiaceae bacterium]
MSEERANTGVIERLEPEDAARALEAVENLLARHRARFIELTERDEEDRPKTHEPVVDYLTELRWVLQDMHPADIAHVLEALPLDDRQIVWDLIRSGALTGEGGEGEILLEVSDSVRESLIAAMDRDELVDAVEQLDAGEVAELAPDLPRDVVEEVASTMTLAEREQLRAAMSYPEESVGARMDFDMVTIRDDVTLEVVLRYLRRFDDLPDHTDQIFVVDREDRFRGALPLKTLLINDPDKQVSEVLQQEVLQLAPLDDISEAAQAFERYDLVSAPVVDAMGKLTGRLTVDRVVDVIREEGEEQVLATAGLREEEDIFANLWSSVKNRGPWLLLNLCTAGFASFVASRFEMTVEKIVALAFLMSIVAGIGGNSGNQTMTLMIRSLALGQITPGNIKRLVQKELVVTLAVGLGGGLIAALFAWAISKSLALGMVMWAAMLLNLLVGATVGLIVPMIRSRMGYDPAVGSSVLLTFATDTMGFFIFLGLATLFLL